MSLKLGTLKLPTGSHFSNTDVKDEIEKVINVITQFVCDRGYNDDSDSQLLKRVKDKLILSSPGWTNNCDGKGYKTDGDKSTGCQGMFFTDDQLTKIITKIRDSSDYKDICKFKSRVISRVYSLPLGLVNYSINRYPNFPLYVNFGRPNMGASALSKFTNPYPTYPTYSTYPTYLNRFRKSGFGGAGDEDQVDESIKSFLEDKDKSAVLSPEDEHKVIKFVDFDDFKNQHSDLKEGTVVGKINIKICKVDHDHNYKCKELNTSINNQENMNLAYKVMKKFDEHESLDDAFNDIDKLLGMLEYFTVPMNTLDKFKQFKQLEGGNYKRKNR